MSHQPPELKRIKIRHITMISLGGIIGAGLFIGSGSLINAAGPGSIFSYAFAGLLVILVMRMLGKCLRLILQAVRSRHMPEKRLDRGLATQSAGYTGFSG